MKSAAPGPGTSPVEVTNVSRHGFWLFIGDRELFVPFTQFPWFRDASVRENTNVQFPSPHHLYWPDLDIDLAVESIEHPEKYPLVSQAQPPKRLQPAKSRRRSPKSERDRRAFAAEAEPLGARVTGGSMHAPTPSTGRFQSIVPQFTVPDVVRTAEYYRDVWGFRIVGYWRDPPVFAIVERDGIELFFNQATPGTTPRTGRVPGGYDIYVRVRGLDALAADLAERGAAILEGPALREYGMRELVVRDCNGLVLALGEDSAPRRYNQRSQPPKPVSAPPRPPR